MVFDCGNKIIMRESTDEVMSVLQFHRYISALFEEDEFIFYQQPTARNSDTEIEMINGWRIDAGVLSILREGSITQGEDRIEFPVEFPKEYSVGFTIMEPEEKIVSPTLRLIREE